MKTVLTVIGVLAAGGLGIAAMSGAFCGGGACALGDAPGSASSLPQSGVVITNASHSTAAPVALTALAGQATAQASAAGGLYEVDGVHSSVVFRIKHGGVSNFYGMFETVGGSFNINLEDPSTSTIDVRVAADSIVSLNKGRDEHLKGTDFFSVKEFPSITFKSSSFTKTGDNTFDVTGELTLLGTSKTVTAKLEDTGRGTGRRGGETSGFEARLEIKRSDFGMNYMVGKGLSDEVGLIISLQGKR